MGVVGVVRVVGAVGAVGVEVAKRWQCCVLMPGWVNSIDEGGPELYFTSITSPTR